MVDWMVASLVGCLALKLAETMERMRAVMLAVMTAVHLVDY